MLPDMNLFKLLFIALRPHLPPLSIYKPTKTGKVKQKNLATFFNKKN